MIATALRGHVGFQAAPGRGVGHRRDFGIDVAPLAIRAASSQISLIGAAASLVRALRRIAKMLDICPPSAGPRV